MGDDSVEVKIAKLEVKVSALEVSVERLTEQVTRLVEVLNKGRGAFGFAVAIAAVVGATAAKILAFIFTRF